MPKSFIEIPFVLKDLVSAPLHKITEGFSKLGEDIKNITGKFDLFGNEGKKDTQKVEKSIAELESELQNLKNKRYWEKDINEVRKLNLEIQELENEIKDLQNTSKSGSLNFIPDNAAHIQAVAESFQTLSDSLDFANDIEDIRNQITLLYDGTPDEIDNITKSAYRLQQQFGDDAQEILQAANAMTKQLGGSFEDNLALIEQGYRKGANLNRNMLDQLREYPSALNGLKISNEQLLAVITQANKEGVWDDKMVDAIKEGYNQLSNLTDDKKAVLQQLGFSPDEIQQAINQGNILDVFKQISGAVSQLDATAQRSALGTLFSSLGEDAQGVILKFQDFSTSINDIDEHLTKFQQRKLKFTGWMADMKSSIAKTTSAWLPFIQFTSASVGTLTALLPALASMKSLTGGISLNIGGLIKSFAGLIPKLFSATTAQWGLNIAMNANPIGAIIIGITAVIAAIVLLVKHMNKITAWFKRQSKFVKIIIGIAAAFNPVLTIIFAISYAIRKLIDNWDKIKAKATEIWHKVVAVFAGIEAVINMLAKKIKTIFKPVLDWFRNQWTAVKEWFSRSWQNIIDWFKNAIQNIKQFIANLKQWAIATFNKIREAVILIFKKIKNFILKIINWINTKFKGFIDKVKTFLQPITDFIKNIFDKVKGFVTKIFDWIKDKFQWLIDLAKKLGIEIGTTFTEAYNKSLEEQTQDVTVNVNTQTNNPQNLNDNNTTTGNNNVLADNSNAGNTGNNVLSGGNNNVAKIFRINVYFDQDFTIKQESDYQKVKELTERTVLEALHDAEIISGND